MGFPSIMVMAALAHDLLEDTHISRDEFEKFLISLDIDLIVLSLVIDLTDEYTKNKYPNLNRNERKKLEVKRKENCHPYSKTIKLLDIEDNIIS